MSRRLSSPRSSSAFAVAAIALFAGLGATAYAHPHPGKAEPAVDRGERRVIIRREGDHVRDRAQHLRDVLQLRANQEGALQAYLEATNKGRERDHLVERFGVQEERKTTPERLAEMEQRLAERQQRQRAMIDATRRFYDQLDPAQKRAFDAMPMLLLPGGRMEVLPIGFRHELGDLHGDIMRGFHGRFPEGHGPMPPPPPAPPAPPVPPPPPRL
jgi:hypothetical protein